MVEGAGLENQKGGNLFEGSNPSPSALPFKNTSLAVLHTVVCYNSSMRTTQRKGDIATTQCIATFTKKGFDVLLPVTESAAYDVVVDDGESLFRIQVKYSSNLEVDLRNIHSNSSGYKIKKTKNNAYDWLYVLHKSGDEYLVEECLSGRRSITFHNDDYKITTSS